MTQFRSSPALGIMAYIALTTVLGLYFAFASIQGNYGLLRRMEIQADRQELAVELASVQVEVARMRNKTRRLSDRYLDLDLLDEQARDVLGLVRADEVIIR